MNAKRADIVSAGPVRPDGDDPEDLGHLLGRVAAGDQAAFAVVYRQVAGPVYGLARAMAGDADWSQQVAAEALTEIWRAAPRYDPSEDSAQSWVMRIARRHVVSHLRAARTGKGHQGRAWLDRQRASQPAADAPGAAGPVCAAEDEAVLLALYGGYTQDEISNQLGFSREAVAGLLRDGLRRTKPAPGA